MKTLLEKAKVILRNKYTDYAKNDWHYTGELVSLVEAGEKAQEFIPLEEEKPPYGEDILVQTPAGSIYFGKMHEGMNGNPDYLQPDLAGSEWQLKIQQIKSWRPIFYK